MADYTVTFARSARKELDNLPVLTAERIVGRIAALVKNARPAGAVKMQGGKNFWRLRVGDYRVIYSIADSTRAVDVSVIRHRREVYRDL